MHIQTRLPSNSLYLNTPVSNYLCNHEDASQLVSSGGLVLGGGSAGGLIKRQNLVGFCVEETWTTTKPLGMAF